MAIVTISRGSLSGGRAVAECLADRLGYRCLAEEILRNAAEEVGVSEEVFRAKFQTPPGVWARLARDRERYLLAARTALLEACLDEELVYHGLAGQFLLADLPGVLRVRLIAPLEMRVRFLTGESHRMSREAAEEFIRNVDQDRHRWVKLVYGAEVEDPSLYHLTVNLRVLSLDGACATIGQAAVLPEYEFTDEVRRVWAAAASESRKRLDVLLAGG